jgi:hypothetical protein
MKTNTKKPAASAGPETGRLIESAGPRFIQIPGPNPLLRSGGPEDWDGGDIECCDVIKDYSDGRRTYYLFYHAQPGLKSDLKQGWRIGVASAPAPLGPWKKHGQNPIVDHGPEGACDEKSVGTASVLKVGKMWYMWYYCVSAGGEGSGDGPRVSRHISLAMAEHPAGPWRKYEGNPVIREDFGYVCGVVRASGKYRLYVTHPLYERKQADEGPVSLAEADRPEGPYTPYAGNPVIPLGEWGTWDDGGFSESRVIYNEGVYHFFYSASPWVANNKLESIGYARSLDGIHFIKHPGNPIGPVEREPDAASISETHALFEYPFVYAFHTARYFSRRGESIGAQIFAMDTPFRLSMPLMSLDMLGAGQRSAAELCPPICLASVSGLSVSVSAVFTEDAAAGARIHIKASHDGLNYDTEDFASFDLHARAGSAVSKTFTVDARIMFAKIEIENLASSELKDLRVSASLGRG